MERVTRNYFLSYTYVGQPGMEGTTMFSNGTFTGVMGLIQREVCKIVSSESIFHVHVKIHIGSRCSTWKHGR